MRLNIMNRLRAQFHRAALGGLRSHDKKIFCIGLNKTGTTSIARALSDLGFRTGNQQAGELLLEDYLRRDFRRIIEFCHTAEAFQDSPFCYPFTYVVLDQVFPKAKFLLTLRNSPEEWRESYIRFHSKRWTGCARICSRHDLREAFSAYKGRPDRENQLVFGAPEEDPYDQDALISYYTGHHRSVERYFQGRPDKLLTLNVSAPADYGRMCAFLNRQPASDDFPWLNKSS